MGSTGGARAPNDKMWERVIEYLTIRLRARDFYAVIVDEGEAKNQLSPLRNRERVI